MNCTDARAKLTAYLDGELADERGSAVRGHLRECADCRRVSEDEAVLRDGLRRMPTMDPPASLWANVQRELAKAEVEDAHRPAWRRFVSSLIPQWRARDWALGVTALAAVTTFVVFRASRHSADVTNTPVIATTAPIASEPVTPVAMSNSDVTNDLKHEQSDRSASYAQTADELMHVATDARATWAPAQQQEFDHNVADLRAAITKAGEGRPQQAAYRSLIRYLQRSAIRDDVAFAGAAL
ncbi:MAG TPA: zf-HC2 domain-containing protein [Kofleriaceae bacterium]|jgi:anti-sigma factor RsiW